MRLRVLVALGIFLLVPSIALASRRATRNEHIAIARAFLGKTYKNVPLRCTRARISTANRTWASIIPIHAGSCSTAPLGDGLAIVHVERRHWRLVTEGSDFRCPIVSYSGQPTVPANVTSDLIRYLHCA